ncbi:hypothetical protein D3C72_652590 [compost metagenome]
MVDMVGALIPLDNLYVPGITNPSTYPFTVLYLRFIVLAPTDAERSNLEDNLSR